MFFSRSTAAAALVAGLPVVFAQTFTSCNPTEKVCPSDAGLAVSHFSSDFTQGSSANASWTAAAYSFINYGPKGAEFTIAKTGQAPTVATDFYFLFGRVDVTMQAAEGQGIISSIVLESDDLDEIDWEFLGGNYTTVETNFFGKGNTTTYDRAIYYPVDSPQTKFHTYSIDWSPQQLTFEIDNNVIRTIPFSDHMTVYGKNYPQTPMRLKLGNWAGGAEGQPKGTVEWAGGPTDFSKAPFTMYVSKVEITNSMPAESYTYGDLSGDWQSIKLGGAVSGSSSSSASASATSSATDSSSTASATDDSSSSAVTSSASVPTASLGVGDVSNQSGAIVSSTVVGNYTPTATGTGLKTSTATKSTATSTITPSTGAASTNQALAASGLISMALGLFMLL